MRQRDKLDILRSEVEIPEIVQRKAEAAFAQIKMEGALLQGNPPERAKGQDMKGKDRQNLKGNRRISGKRFWPAATAAAVAVTVLGVGAAAAYSQWSKGMGDGLQVSSEMRQELEDIQMASFPEQSVTQGDVTVTAQQAIVDSHFARISFKVEGFTVEDGIEPGFASTSVNVGTKDGSYTSEHASGSLISHFYDGLIIENGKAMYPDGTPLTEDSVISYTMEDGSLEYQIDMFSDEKDYYIGKEIYVELKDLGIASQFAGEPEVKVPGTWSFEWTLPGNNEVKSFELDETLGDSGAVVTGAELSPLSASATYEMPRHTETELGIDENGAEFTHEYFREPPHLTGVKLKDGTMYTGIMGGGQEGYVSEKSDTYEVIYSLMRAIDPNEVESLLFVKSYPEGGEPLQEENLYIVPIQ